MVIMDKNKINEVVLNLISTVVDCPESYTDNQHTMIVVLGEVRAILDLAYELTKDMPKNN